MVAFSISYLLFRISCTIVFHTSSGILEPIKSALSNVINDISYISFFDFYKL